MFQRLFLQQSYKIKIKKRLMTAQIHTILKRIANEILYFAETINRKVNEYEKNNGNCISNSVNNGVCN